MLFGRARYFSRMIWPVPCPKRPCAVVLLKRHFRLAPSTLAPSIDVGEPAVAEPTPLPRRSKPAGSLLASDTWRAGPRWSLGAHGASVSPASGLLAREIRDARHVHECHA